MPRTPEQEVAIALHRAPDGTSLLVGPNCPACEQRAVARYRCTTCPAMFDVLGVYRWHWQGLGHWHEPDDRAEWMATVSGHVDGHHGRAGIVPA